MCLVPWRAQPEIPQHNVNNLVCRRFAMHSQPGASPQGGHGVPAQGSSKWDATERQFRGASVWSIAQKWSTFVATNVLKARSDICANIGLSPPFNPAPFYIHYSPIPVVQLATEMRPKTFFQNKRTKITAYLWGFGFCKQFVNIHELPLTVTLGYCLLYIV